ncbi:nitrate- and nitrite sensing domain-containing protein [Streptomyces sp. NPDC002467]|uniref:nitrate- and nitrite sensing domain-containing protein n=1 Tax=Streptomyces sp. NPDC002467 TaxID=3364647 RepID=UPI0036B6D3C0
MRFRGKSIRRKIVALLLVPLVSLTALWGFATVITGREAVQLFDVAYVIDKVGLPVEETARVIQKERRQSLVLLGDPRAAGAIAELTKSRAATDEAVERISASARDPKVMDELSPQSTHQLQNIVDAFHGIGSVRRSVDQNSVDPTQALELFNRLIDPCYDYLMNLHGLDDVEVDKEGRALVGVSRARELFSREDAVMASALIARNVEGTSVRQVSDLVANRKLLYEFNLVTLPAEDRERFERYWTGTDTKALRDAEERFITAGVGKNPRSASPAQWDELASKTLGDLATMDNEAGERYQQRIEPVAMDVMIQAAIAGVLGFIALIVSLILSVRIGRELIRDLSRLRKEAHEASGVRLPSVMRRLAAGEHVDVETESPHLEYEKDEVGQVGQALNSLQRAAVEAAVKQAELRRGVSEVFVNLARRNQVLLHRQLTLLDTMERRTEDSEELADLFRLDHMTTRMRRHAEGLVILSGAAPSRQWRKPVQLMDVVRAAVAEVEDYERIEVRRLSRLGIVGPAVADVTHLIAELLENATVFSPPHTAVQVLGERVANGFTLEIHDRGLGMTPEALLDANLRLAETPEFELSDTDRLGLFVVSRLAQRHSVKVVLQTSPYGGTTAVVFLPSSLLTEAPETNGAGARLDGSGKAASERRGPAAVDRGKTGGRQLATAELRGPVELEAPLDLNGADALDGTLDDTIVTGIAGLTGVGGRPAMATLDDETPPGGTPRSALLGLRPADRPHAERNGTRQGAGREPLAPTGPVRLEAQRADAAPRTDGRRAPGAVPLPRRRPAPTLVAEHGRRVEPRAVSGTGTGTVKPAQGAAPATATDDAVAGGGLPRRVRQASLAPQLKNASARKAADSPAEPVDHRDADDVRTRMSALQRGWTAGRNHHAQQQSETDAGTSAATGPANENEGDGR